MMKQIKCPDGAGMTCLSWIGVCEKSGKYVREFHGSSRVVTLDPVNDFSAWIGIHSYKFCTSLMMKG